MVEQRSPKPLVACSNRVSPAKTSQLTLGRFCFIRIRPRKVACDARRLAIPSQAPYESRLPCQNVSTLLGRFCFI